MTRLAASVLLPSGDGAYAVPAPVVAAPLLKSRPAPSYRSPSSGGTIACGGGGNAGFSSPSICDADNEYVCASFRICAAASWRFASWVAISVSADFCATADASGSLRAANAASKLARAPAWVRGIAAWADAIAFEACVSHFDAPSL
ncbi:hypothetical protein ABZY10_12575 [Streptomyces sp. NPDC006539]|uniref:hypothetical protein n=1 Tax=Streptomyces sp. NPDC006539 TaxID=3155352 RepID=UPI0033A45410